MSKLPVDKDYYTKDVAKNYVNKRKNQKHWKKEDEIINVICNNLHDVKTVLDAPFGTGRFIPIYNKNQYKIYGLEISQDMIQEAHNQWKNLIKSCDIQQGSVTDMPYDNKSFDLSVCTRLFTIISFKDVKLAVKEFSRVTKKYGILQFGIDNSIDIIRDGVIDEDKKLGKALTYSEVKNLLEINGFSILKTYPVQLTNIIFLCKVRKWQN